MKIIDHGEWESYTPSVHPQELPKNVLFARRKSDLVDWYDYIYPKDKEAAPRFGKDTFKCAASWQEMFNAYIVGPVTQDVTMIFPSNRIVFEIADYTGDDAFAEFNNKAYDPATGTFSDSIAPVAKLPFLTKIDELSDRLAKLEIELAAQKREGN